MQLGAAAVFLLEAVSSVAISLLFVNHDSMLKALQAQGTLNATQGVSIDDLVNVSIAIALGVVIVLAVLEIVGAVGSFIGWRWMFWVALVLFGLGGLSNVFGNLPALARPATSAIPVGGLAVSVLVGIASLAMFAWMLVGVIKYGPWAMKKPGAR
jgi:MFS family permease